MERLCTLHFAQIHLDTEQNQKKKDTAMKTQSELIDLSAQRYGEYGLGKLPRQLKRNSHDYYYLSVYPSLQDMAYLDEDSLPVHPENITTAYVHIPFCSGICDFCSYFVLAAQSHSPKVASYMRMLRREVALHAERTDLRISYLYFGGGTPSLVPPGLLDEFLSSLRQDGHLEDTLYGTVELRPEIFRDEGVAQNLFDVLKKHSIRRVSVGYESSDTGVLKTSNRRHGIDFIHRAVEIIRSNGMIYNLDLMYGLPKQSLRGWETTLRTALGLAPDSVSVYFLFVDPGTSLHTKVRRGRTVLPSHRHIQIQHIMAQEFLETHGYYELPGDFFAKTNSPVAEFCGSALPSDAATLPLGAGAYGFFDGTQLCNVFNMAEYERRVCTGRLPLWRGARLNGEDCLRRDIMFLFKNQLAVSTEVLMRRHGSDPNSLFFDELSLLERLGMTESDNGVIRLTSKGRLCVEEIACLFQGRLPTSGTDVLPKDTKILKKYSFAPTYGRTTSD